jgi:hypothetical protein
MTMPDQIQITHRPRTMSTPIICAALDTFQQAANRGTAVYLSPELVQELRAALKAEPEREGPRLQWTDNMPPSEACRYDHCIAETPFGRFLITWKGWKEYDSPTVDETPWGDWYAAFNSVDDAKAACQQGMNERLTRCGTPATPPAPEKGEAPSAADLLPVEPPNIPTTMAMQYRSAWREGVEDGWSEARAILARRGHPPAAAPAPGENLATPPAPEPGPTYLDAIRLAQGCHTYSGGHSGTEGEAWHSAIDTVVAVLKRAAVGPWDSQTRAVYGVGVEAGAGEVAELGPVSERLAGDVATDDETSGNIVLLAGGIEEIADFLYEMEKYDWYATLNRASKHLQRLNRAAQSAQVPAPQAGEVEA